MDIPPEIQEAMNGVQESQENMQMAGYVCFIAWAVLLAVFCIFQGRIRISIGVRIEEAEAMPTLPNLPMPAAELRASPHYD